MTRGRRPRFKRRDGLWTTWHHVLLLATAVRAADRGRCGGRATAVRAAKPPRRWQHAMMTLETPAIIVAIAIRRRVIHTRRRRAALLLL